MKGVTVDFTDRNSPDDLVADWVVRCPTCGKRRPLEGSCTAPRTMIRKKVNWCTRCRGLRIVIIEPADAHPAGMREEQAVS